MIKSTPQASLSGRNQQHGGYEDCNTTTAVQTGQPAIMVTSDPQKRKESESPDMKQFANLRRKHVKTFK